jgi:Protein of unknown function (DUF4241)
MKTIQLFLVITSIWTFSSCNNKGQDNSFKTNSIQDAERKVVRQNVFGEEISFNYSDFYDLQNNKKYDRFLIGQLNLPTGKVVCTDPMFRELGLPQTWTVKKGKYPVYIYIGLSDNFEGRVAYAELAIKDEKPTYWELSLIAENLLSDNLEKKINGMYPVEAGLSCFADFETYKLLDDEVSDYNKADSSNNYYTDKLEKLFKGNKNIPKSSRSENWINYQLHHSNIIIFGSGQGDGLYPRYVGYDKDGNVIKFITDFIQIKDEEEK